MHEPVTVLNMVWLVIFYEFSTGNPRREERPDALSVIEELFLSPHPLGQRACSPIPKPTHSSPVIQDVHSGLRHEVLYVFLFFSPDKGHSPYPSGEEKENPVGRTYSG